MTRDRSSITGPHRPCTRREGPGSAGEVNLTVDGRPVASRQQITGPLQLVARRRTVSVPCLFPWWCGCRR